MKKNLLILSAIILSGVSGWILGFLRLPYVEKNQSFWMGFLACLSFLSLIFLIFLIWKKNASVLNGIKNANSNDSKSISKTYQFIWLLLSGFVLIGSLTSGYFIFQQNKFSKNQFKKQNEKITQQLQLMETTRKSNLIVLMNNLMGKIQEEINSNPQRKISNETIERIAALNHSFQPYAYSQNDSLAIKKLSPERGQLLLSLSKMKIDTTSFALIKSKTSFLGADLRNINLSGADLSGVDLREADLSHSNLRNANLKNADLRNSIFWGVQLDSASLIAANFTNADLQWIEANDSDWRKAKLNGVLLHSAKFRRANLNEAIFTWAKINGGFFNEANFIKTDLSGSDFGGSNFTNTNLTNANLKLANLSEVNLTEANLTGVNIDRTTVDIQNWYEQLKQWNVIGVEAIESTQEILDDYAKEFKFRLKKIEN